MTYPASDTSGFSFSRSMAFGAYYMPRLRKQLMIYSLVSLACSLIALIPAHETLQMGLFVMIWTLLPLLFYCGPLIFAKGADSRIIDRLIPASTAEKLLFFYLYILVAIPISVYLLPLLAGVIYINVPSMQTPGVMELYDMKLSFLGVFNLINIIGGCMIAMVCFYCVEYARHNRLLWGIVGVVAGNTFLALLGAIMGGMAAFKAGLEDGLSGKEIHDDAAVKELTTRVINKLGTMDAMTLTVVGIVSAMTLVTAYLTYRTLKKRNL